MSELNFPEFDVMKRTAQLQAQKRNTTVVPLTWHEQEIPKTNAHQSIRKPFEIPELDCGACDVAPLYVLTYQIGEMVEKPEYVKLEEDLLEGMADNPLIRGIENGPQTATQAALIADLAAMRMEVLALAARGIEVAFLRG